MDGKRQRQELDKKKNEKKGRVDKAHMQRLWRTPDYLRNSERKGIKRGGEVDEVHSEGNNTKNKRSKRQHKVTEEREEEKKEMNIKQENNGENDQSKQMKKEKKKETDST